MKRDEVIRLTPIREVRRALPALAILSGVVLTAALTRETFLTLRNLTNVLVQFTPLALAALAQTIVLLVGGIDLSIGAVMSLSTVLLANFSGTGQWALPQGLALVLLVALVVGSMHALAVLRAGVAPLILTLGTMAMVRGVAYWIQPVPGGSVPLALGELINWRAGIMSIPLLVLMLAYAAATFVLTGTIWGQHTYATGANPAHAKLAGVRTVRITAGAYVASSLLAAVAGVLLAGRIFSGDAMVGDPFTLDALVASVIGGTSVLGGAGSVLGALVGAALLGTVNNVLNLFHVPAFYQYLLKGVLLLVTLLAMFGRQARRPGGEEA